MWVAITNMDMLIPLIRLDPALHAHYLGLVEELHTEQMFHVHFLKLLRRVRRYFIPGCLLVVGWLLISLIVDLPISASIETLEK